jgi:transposase-like protein
MRYGVNAQRETPTKIRQTKYLNNIIEQDHRAIKRRTRPMLGFKDFRCARILLSGIEIMHMIAKGQMTDHGARQTPPRSNSTRFRNKGSSSYRHFCRLASLSRQNH